MTFKPTSNFTPYPFYLLQTKQNNSQDIVTKSINFITERKTIASNHHILHILSNKSITLQVWKIEPHKLRNILGIYHTSMIYHNLSWISKKIIVTTPNWICTMEIKKELKLKIITRFSQSSLSVNNHGNKEAPL